MVTRRKASKSFSYFLAAACLALPIFGQATPETAGTVSGVVINLANGTLLNQATIQVLPDGPMVVTDLDGLYSLELAPGRYDLQVTLAGFVQQTVQGVEVGPGKITYQDIGLNPEGMQLGEVTVIAEADRTSTIALLAERKSAPTVSDSIGAQEMSRLTGSDAAEVLQTVTGISILDDRHVYIRGLGERYSSTLLNGSLLPSTQPDRKVVPLDLFPASLLESIRAEKSFTPDQPGEFSGGLIQVRTADFPRQAVFKISVSQGFGTHTTFQDFQTYPGGGLDWLGFDDGTRALPAGIPPQRLVRSNRFSSGGFSPEELEQFGESFSNVWSPRSRNAIPNQGFNVVAGDTFGRFGVIFALSHSDKLHNQNEVLNVFRVSQGNVTPIHNYDFEISQRSVRTGTTANLAFDLTKNQRFFFRNFYSRDTSDEARMYEGFNGDARNEVRNIRLRFVEEGIYSGQLGGEHFLNLFGNSLLEWKLSYSRSSLDEPDLREVLYEERDGFFVLADESQSGFRMFNDLDENLWEPSVDWTTFLMRGGLTGSVKVGTSYRDRSRDFSSRRFRFTPRNTQQIDLTQPPEELFSPQNIRSDGFEIREETRPTDTYFASEITRAAYAMTDLTLGRWRVIGGARLEHDTLDVTTFDLFDRNNPNSVNSRIDQTDWLPSVNVIYRLTPDMNLRGSVSRTVNRPEFRELAPFEFTDVVGGRSIVGNPLLTRARIRNFDLRWEWFTSAEELLSASFFYKNFDDPIERVVEPTAQLRTSFINADGARNRGLELDVRKNLGLLAPSLDNFTVFANYTFVDSTVEIPDRPLVVLTSLNRPLAGQSRHVVNAILEYEFPRSQSLARLLFNYQGRRITDVGAVGLPDIFQEGYPRVDALLIHPFAEKWDLKLAAENLLDRTMEYTQGGEIHRAFSTGRVFTVTISRSLIGE